MNLLHQVLFGVVAHIGNANLVRPWRINTNRQATSPTGRHLVWAENLEWISQITIYESSDLFGNIGHVILPALKSILLRPAAEYSGGTYSLSNESDLRTNGVAGCNRIQSFIVVATATQKTAWRQTAFNEGVAYCTHQASAGRERSVR
jgi:hypothetical protein